MANVRKQKQNKVDDVTPKLSDGKFISIHFWLCRMNRVNLGCNNLKETNSVSHISSVGESAYHATGV